MRPILARALAFLLLWLAVAGRKPSDLSVGLAVTVAATWASVLLAPPSNGRLNLRHALVYVLDFLRLSLTSGLDVARRALSPKLNLRPGMVEAQMKLPPGFARNAFCVIANLMPGTVLTGFDPGDDQKVYVHALDVGQPIVADLSDEEASFMRMIGHG